MTTGAFVFPTRLFGPTSLQVRRLGQAVGGGASISGEQLFADISGGGRAVADFEAPSGPWRRDRLMAWHQFAEFADGGAQPLIVPIADRRRQPVRPQYTGADGFGLSTWASDVTAFTPTEVTAATSGSAAVGATSLSIAAFTAPLPLAGGELFAICHTTWSWRLYFVKRVTAGGLGSGDATTLTFGPPLREAVADDTVLNFESPRFVAQSIGDPSLTVQMFKQGKASARFVEWPGVPSF